MKITKIEDLHADGGWRTLSYIKISTDEGIIGWSETCEGMAGPGLTMVIRRLAERLIGRDPRDVGPIGTDLYIATQMSQGGMMAQAIAALENACLDIKGKAAGLSVHALFGGAYRTRLPVYWSHCGTYRVRSAELFERVNKTPPIRTLDDLKALGREVVARGFKALLYDTIRSLTKPLIVSIHGHCTGAALQLSLLADLRIGGSDAKIGMTELNVGMPVVIGSSLLRAVVGEAVMRRLILLADFVPSEQALTFNLLNEVVPNDELDARVTAIAQKISERPPAAIKLTKAWWNEITAPLIEQTWSYARTNRGMLAEARRKNLPERFQ